MTKQVFFSLIVVCLNAGDKLIATVDSILMQDYDNYEIIVKDGISKDGSIEKLPENSKIKIFREKDSGIYEAMNQASLKAQGDYVLFLNCGDAFYEADVLRKTADFIEKKPGHGIYYGDTYCEQTHALVVSAPEITPFTCYRNIPCHQSCFYRKDLLEKKPYDPVFRIRADYEHFLWCYFKADAKPVHMKFVLASYEGGGYSESKANRKRDKQEHKQIVKMYLSLTQRMRFAFVMAITLAPLRRFLAEKTPLSGVYHKIKAGLYR